MTVLQARVPFLSLILLVFTASDLIRLVFQESGQSQPVRILAPGNCVWPTTVERPREEAHEKNRKPIDPVISGGWISKQSVV